MFRSLFSSQLPARPSSQTLILSGLAVLTLSLASFASAFADDLRLTLRYRESIAPKATQFHVRTRAESWKPRETAIIVCDMWDAHHCWNAVQRETEMAPRMNKVLKTARGQGVLIVHAPSSCMKFYEGQPARKRAQNAPKADNLPADIGAWCHVIPSEEQGEYPIDQSDGGEDDEPAEHAEWAAKLKAMGRNPRAPWVRQIDLLEIDDKLDAISDNGVEIWNLLEHRGIKNVVLMGVHTNMCVLGRPFGLRQMAKNGKNVVLMRDLTDTMYNPKAKPYVSHFTGTDLIVEHIEKWVCPTITSDQILRITKPLDDRALAGQVRITKPFRYSTDKRPHVVMLIGEKEYKTKDTLPPFAIESLGKKYQVSIVHASVAKQNTMPGIEVLADADVLLVSVRRRAFPKPQLQLVRDHVAKGRPVIGIRTANHAFAVRGDLPEGHDVWMDWDEQVIGGSYSGHHGRGAAVEVSKSAEHAILDGVDVSSLKGIGTLYKVSPLRKRSTEILRGSVPGQPSEPIAWTHSTEHGGKVFYTSLGHEGDFQQPAFQRLLTNAVDWSLQ